MFGKISRLFEAAMLSRQHAADKIVCFHCGELVRRKRAVTVQFDGQSHAVCCHGCAAILRTVEALGQCAQYQASKSRSSTDHE
jgi:Putative metal-binding domain of cation transport ATPase